MRLSCPQPPQPIPVPCAIGPVEIKFFGMGQSFNISGLLPYANYELCVVSYNNMGSTVSDWDSITTLKEPPQYMEAFVVHSNLTSVFVDWSGSFSLNGPLTEYSLTESSLRVYSGFHNSLHIPRTSDKTFAFQVTCTTDSGSASSPVIKYNTATGIGMFLQVCQVKVTGETKQSLHPECLSRAVPLPVSLLQTLSQLLLKSSLFVVYKAIDV